MSNVDSEVRQSVKNTTCVTSVLSHKCRRWSMAYFDFARKSQDFCNQLYLWFTAQLHNLLLWLEETPHSRVLATQNDSQEPGKVLMPVAIPRTDAPKSPIFSMNNGRDVNLTDAKFGKATVAWNFLGSGSRWGRLDAQPVAVLMFEFIFDQPRGFELESVEFELIFHAVGERHISPQIRSCAPSSFYETTHQEKKTSRFQIIPEFQGAGFGGGGVEAKDLRR